MLSVIIPSFKDPLIQKTVDSLLDTSELGDQLEVIVVLDGPWLETPLKKDPRVRVIQLPENKGMRNAINTGIKESKGDYIMKVDSHCLFGQGFDKVMVDNCQEDWLLVPRRYSLDEKNWTRDDGRYVRDYHYLCSPGENMYGFGMEVTDWIRYNRDSILIDDTMIFQGSCWLANKKYFMEHVGFLDDRKETYGPFAQEQLEIGLKYWLGGGAIKVNKKTWYAHLSKREHHYASGEYDRSHKQASHNRHGHTWATEHWINNREPGMKYPFQWLVQKFKPPKWPSN